MPIIIRGSGGVDVSGVTATADSVLEGSSFVDANGDTVSGGLKKQTKTATMRYSYFSVEVEPDAGHLLEKVTFKYCALSARVSPSSTSRSITYNNVTLSTDKIKDIVLVCRETSEAGTIYGGTYRGRIFAMHIIMSYKYGVDYLCFITGQDGDGRGFCTSTLLGSVGTITLNEYGRPTITLNDEYYFLDKEYQLTIIAEQ